MARKLLLPILVAVLMLVTMTPARAMAPLEAQNRVGGFEVVCGLCVGAKAAGESRFVGAKGALGYDFTARSTLAARGGGRFASVDGAAYPVPLHDVSTPWYKYLRPKYSSTEAYDIFTKDAAKIATAKAHELKHLADFARFPQITYIAAKKGLYYPGRGLARYFFEARAYGHVGQLTHPFVPFKSLGWKHGLGFAGDVLLFGGGTGAGVYLNLSLE